MPQDRVAEQIETKDGRLLRVDISGMRGGTPVMLLHGSPGSRNGPKPRGSVLYRLGVQLITYDRPGYGGSSRQPGRTVADAAEDVRCIADFLKIDQFAVVGRSGGGPHALACAALLPELVTRTAVLVSVAPSDASDLDWYEGMTKSNVDEYVVADADLALLSDRLRFRAAQTLSEPTNLTHMLGPDLRTPDRRVLSDVAIRRLLADTYAEALRDGPDGWIDDVYALRGDWGFNLDAIKGPVLLWHGADDNFSPVSHTHWLAERIPHAEVLVQRHTAHFGAVEILPQILAWVTTVDNDLVDAQQGARI